MKAYRSRLARLMSAHRTSEGESSSLPTPTASSYGSNQGGGWSDWRTEVLPHHLGEAGATVLATPTETGNQLSPSMRQWPSCLAWQLIHPPGPLLPSFVEWMMGFPYDWTTPAGARTKRNKALGNAVVPQCAEVIGHVVAQLRLR